MVAHIELLFKRARAPSLRELILWLTLMFVAARVCNDVTQLGFLGFVSAIAQHNLVYVLCYIAIVSRALQINTAVVATRFDVALVVTSGAAIAALSGFAIDALDGPVALAAGAYFLATGHARDASLRAIGVIFLAIGCNMFIGRIILMAFQAQIVSVDAFLVQNALWLTGDAAPRVANHVVSETGFSVAIVGACSAFNNITLMMLAVVAGVMWVRPRFQSSDLKWLGIGALLLIALNTLRMGLMAQNYDSYAYWHDGAGQQYIALAQTSLVFIIAFLAAHSSRPTAKSEIQI